ncbi:Uncharacterized conserved protein YndB, AHSA1/START domain [Sphingomonas sp. OV641]|uniref:hypothetical protein n=1 Tax=Sphingomonas sp. OV641 TaxID=1881068 RepID=UPI0008B66CCE|nr:hypothetical protein [Sphingomonas sp. OV641]SEJ25520.1 Uncharacterized conserved protein YndB, AHSA1/START domain [Sphingomonas sp. OV641]
MQTRLGCAIAAAALSTAAGQARGDVIAVHPGGFETAAVVSIAAPAERVWATLQSPALWWEPEHTYSGDSANLSLGAQAGGCFCERLPGSGSVEHARVIYIQPSQVLRLQGGLGPLQAEAVTGVLTFELLAQETGTTQVKMTYLVSGHLRAGSEKLAPLVDQVLTLQLQRLKAAALKSLR